MALIRILLFPLSVLYGFLVSVRNLLFNWKIFRSAEFDMPVISVGNLSVGGTGKTPHVEYIIRLLIDSYKVATLSRGYKRKTSGFLLADSKSTELEIGDEPLQYVRKFQDVKVAVDARRKRGITKLGRMEPSPDLVILDDAFQHRYVKPGLSILLTDFHNIYKEDFLLPAGTLREQRSSAKRADIIIVTKTPRVLSPLTRRRIQNLIRPRAYQKLFFSYISYDEPKPLFEDRFTSPPKKKHNYILLFTGIANPYPLQEYLSSMCHELITIEFPDHHRYNKNDLDKIVDTYNDIFARDKIIYTTEKDAMRLALPEFRSYLDDLPVFYIPIKVNFHKCDDARFDKCVKEYVEKHSKKP
jgi:tetraacyldisaccharide 4'-kinase